MDQKVEAIIRYSHIYSGAYYNKLASQFEEFKEATDDYSFGFMELYTIAALGVSLHSPTISESNFHTHVLGAMERQINYYFENRTNEFYQNLLSYIDFEKKYANELIKSSYNFSDVPAYWLLYTHNTYKAFESDYKLINTLGNELTNHYIHVFENSWEAREIKSEDLLPL